MIIRIRKNRDFIIFYMSCMLLLPAINDFFNTFIQIGIGINFSTSAVVYIFMALLSGIAILKFAPKNRNTLLFSMMIVVGMWISYFLYPDIRNVIYGKPYDLIYNNINVVTFFCLPVFITVPYIQDYNEIFDKIAKCSLFATLIGSACYIYVAIIAHKHLEYMSYSYFMLLPVSFCYENYMDKKKISYLIIALLGTVCMIFGGARGAFVSLCILLVIRTLFNKDRKMKTKIFSLIIFVVLMTGLISYYHELLQWIKHITDILGINSRFIDKLLDNSIMTTSGRDLIRNAMLAGISDNPFGFGLFGDRYVSSAYNMGYGRVNTYAHNFILEVLCDFGIIVGPFLIITLVIKLFAALHRSTNKYYKCFIWAMMPYGMFQLLFSSSFMVNSTFYAICGCVFLQNTGKLMGGRHEKNN